MPFINPVEHNLLAPPDPMAGTVIADRYVVCVGSVISGATFPPDGWTVTDMQAGISKAYDGMVPTAASPQYANRVDNDGTYAWIVGNGYLLRADLDGVIVSYVVPGTGAANLNAVLCAGGRVYCYRQANSDAIRVFNPSNQSWSTGSTTSGVNALLDTYGGSVYAWTSNIGIWAVDSNGDHTTNTSAASVSGYVHGGRARVGSEIILTQNNVNVYGLTPTSVRTITGIGLGRCRPAAYGSYILTAINGGVKAANVMNGATHMLSRPTPRQYGSAVFNVGGKIWAPSGDPRT